MSHLKRELGLFSCTLLVAGNMIGIGIFVTAGRIYTLLPHPGYIFLAWLIGGLLSLAGGLVYAELGTRFPRAGGGYVFLREAFGPQVGYLAGFAATMITVPGTAAFLAMGVTKYLGLTDIWVAKSVGIGLVLGMSWINYRGVMRGATLQNGFMLLKFSLIFGLILAGFMSMHGSLAHFVTSMPLSLPLFTALPLALVPIMYTYSGWDATAFITEEVKNPRQTLPFSMAIGTLLVSATYMALAALYVYAIPVTALDSKEKIVTSVSVVFFGSAIGHIIGLLVGVSVLGCLAATVLVGPRVIFAMSRDGMLPKFASDIHPDYFTPGNAIVLQAIMTSILVFSGTFDTLLDYITVPSVFFSGLNGVGLFVLRMRQRSEENAQVYKTFGYPLVPGLFVVGMMWIVINTVLKNPTNSIWGLAMVCIGIPIYYLIKVVHLSYSVADSKDLLTIPPELCRGGKPCELLPSALAALEDMVAEAKKTNIDIVVISAHRTRDFQKELFEDAQQRHGKSHAIRWVAPPGRSEHHTGYVVDLADLNCPEYDDEPGFENTPAGLWLLENGPRFGFKLSFPKNNWQKIGYEPWHWRFEGTLDAYAQFHHGIWNKITHIVFS